MQVMDNVMKRVEKALKNIRPSQIDFGDFEKRGFQDKPMVVVRVISTGFEDMRFATRSRVMDDTISSRDPQLKENYIFAFECYTPQEYKLVKLQRNALH